MYICICRQVTDSQLRLAIDQGAKTVRHLRNSLGVTSQCGKCANCVKDCLNEHKAISAFSDQLIPSAYSA